MSTMDLACPAFSLLVSYVGPGNNLSCFLLDAYIFIITKNYLYLFNVETINHFINYNVISVTAGLDIKASLIAWG